MKRAVEFAFFLGIAATAHLALATLGPEENGANSAGQDGGAAVTLQAASTEVSDMVARWEAPPEALEQTPTAAIEPPATETVPDLPTPDPAPARLPRMLGLRLPSADGAPDTLETAPAAPAITRSEVSDTRPRMRPTTQAKPKPEAPEPEPEKAPKKPASSASAGQTAKGSGGGANAGNAGTSAAATLSAGQRQSLVAQWGAQVRTRIERSKRYPSSARGASGTVQIRIAVGRDGGLRGVSVAGSSGHASLDAAAIKAVQSARRFPAAPRQLDQPVYTFTLAMKFGR